MAEVLAPKKVKQIGTAFRALATALLGRAQLAGRDGVTFDGARNLYTALGYPRIINPDDYRQKYERDGVAHRIVEAFPLSSWRGGGDIYEDADPKTETAFEKAWNALNKKHSIWSKFQQLDIVSGIGRYGVLFIGAPGDVSTPLTKLKPEDLMYLSPFDESGANIINYETDFESPRFGLPVMYGLTRTDIISNSTMVLTGNSNNPVQRGKPVHWSRVIHVAEGLIDNRVFGQPRLMKVWNLLLDLMKVTGGGAEAFFKRADGGMQLDLDPEIELDAAGEQAIEDSIEKYTNNLERVMLTRGIKLNRLGSDVADFKGPASAIFDQLSAATGIPQRILMGSERGELSSSNDQSNWEERVSDRRTDFCEQVIIRQTVDRFIELGTLPEPEEYFTEWPEVEELDEGEKVTVSVQLADLNAKAGDIVVTNSEIRERYLGLPEMSVEQKTEIAEQKATRLAEQQQMMQQEAALKAPTVIEEKPAQRQVPVFEEKPKTAVARALELAVENGRRVLQRPELRAAMSAGEESQLHTLLERSVEAVEQTLRGDDYWITDRHPRLTAMREKHTREMSSVLAEVKTHHAEMRDRFADVRQTPVQLPVAATLPPNITVHMPEAKSPEPPTVIVNVPDQRPAIVALGKRLEYDDEGRIVRIIPEAV